jgi:hypothetical protein
VVPPSFAHVLRHEPLRAEQPVLIVGTDPITVVNRRGLFNPIFINLSIGRFFLAATGPSSRHWHTGFPPTARSLYDQETVTLPINAFQYLFVQVINVCI